MNDMTPTPGDIEERYRSRTVEQALAHLVEELNEAAAAGAKGLRFGLHCHNPELPPIRQETNLHWLTREIGDVWRAWLVLQDLIKERADG